MTAPSPPPRSLRGFCLAGPIGFLALALAGCAASSTNEGSGTGGSSADGGSSDGGASGGSSGSLGSGGNHGSGGATSSGGRSGSGSGGATAGGSGGSSGATGGNSGAAGSGVMPGCLITLTPVAPASSIVEVGPTAKLEIQAVVTHAKVATPQWTWTVTSPSLMVLMPTPMGDGSRVQFLVTTEGKYQIVARVTNDPTCGQGLLLIMGTVATPSFNLRVTAAGFPVQEKRLTPSNSTSVSVTLDPGATYQIEPRQEGQITVMPAYLRITSAATTFDVEGYTAHGAVRANLINVLYDLLVVPNDPTFAPNLFRSVTPDVWNQPITFDQGVPVSGLILGPDGAPLANARMILKADGRPSTVGTSNASGALTLWTRTGNNMSAIVVPPDGSGLPQANVDATSGAGVNLPSADGSLMLTMQYHPAATGALTVTVRDPNGAGPVAGARVRVSSSAAMPGAGTLTSRSPGADVELAASGSISTEVVSDANGNARVGSLPTGSYHVVVVPSSSNAGAITALDVTVPAAGLTKTLSLARKVSLTGTLAAPSGSVGPSSVAGASITALDKTGDVAGSVVSTTADATGAFALQVDPNRNYQLLIQPVARQALGRMVVPLAVGATDLKAKLITLPPGLTFTGTVSGGSSTVGGAFLQVFCVPSATWCPDATVSVAESTTNPDGTFSFILPNPAP